MKIALKECLETYYLLELITRTETIREEVANPIESMCSRLRYMLIKSLNTAKGKDVW